MLITDLPTPFVAIDQTRVQANIAAMQALANSAGVALRPHTKTHKSVTIARWQLAAGAAGICCAKLAEAEVFAAAGITDIRLPYPVNPANADRVLALLARKVRLSIIVDSLDVARQWSQVMNAARQRLDVLIKVDVGFHRCGIDPDSPQALETIKTIAGLTGLNVRGLLSHAGHGYNAGSDDELVKIAGQEASLLGTLAAGARAAAVEVAEISVGATPTARFITLQRGVTEMRPGNYVFYDRSQAGLGATPLSGCAMTVIATVVSRPASSRVIFDAGSKTLTVDAVRGFAPASGHGLVYPSLTATEPDTAIVIDRLSEEHTVARVPAACALKPGDRVRIVPNHACVVTNLADQLVLCEGLEVAGRIPVDARGKNY